MTVHKIKSIEKYQYTGKVYNTEVEPTHPTKDDQFYINAENGLVVHNCHPRDNIALRWLAKEYEIGYDLFDTIMHAREIQAANMAKFLQQHSEANNNLPVIIHGKAYKPDVEFCIGSYSTLVGHYLEQLGVSVTYADPLADNADKVNNNIDYPAVILLAHNRNITYGYTGVDAVDGFYFKVQPGSVIVDPWRKVELDSIPNVKVVHYGNTRV